MVDCFGLAWCVHRIASQVSTMIPDFRLFFVMFSWSVLLALSQATLSYTLSHPSGSICSGKICVTDKVICTHFFTSPSLPQCRLYIYCYNSEFLYQWSCFMFPMWASFGEPGWEYWLPQQSELCPTGYNQTSEPSATSVPHSRTCQRQFAGLFDVVFYLTFNAWQPSAKITGFSDSFQLGISNDRF